eukprot:gene32722-3606_t
MSDAPAATKPAAAKPRVAQKPKVPAAHPPFADMIKEAIITLKERSGSSVQAITKCIGAKYANKLPATYPKLVFTQLKRLASAEKLVKVKASYKLGEAMKKAPAKKVVKKKAGKTAASSTAPFTMSACTSLLPVDMNQQVDAGPVLE